MLNINLNEIKNIEKKVTNKNYTHKWDEKTCSLIKNDKQFFHYFAKGNLDGSGAVYPFMYELIKRYQPKHVVELGNREGMGILSIYSALKENECGVLSTIDIIKDLRFIPEEIRNDNKIDYIFGDVSDDLVIEKVKQNKPKIDFILFDTTHTYEQIKIEWDKYKPLLASQAIVLIDDLDFEHDPQNKKQKFFNELEKCEKYSSKKIHSSGFGVVLYDEKTYKQSKSLDDLDADDFWATQ